MFLFLFLVTSIFFCTISSFSLLINCWSHTENFLVVRPEQ
jgi:hypothetical protein